MKLSLTSHITINTLTPIDLDELIEGIQAEYHGKEVQKIRLLLSANDEKSHDQAKKKKLNLPLFLPCVFAESKAKDELPLTAKPTGLIQFDIDLKDNPDLQVIDAFNVLKTLPYVIYAYISVSGGLKFVIKSNFAALEGDTFKQTRSRFARAYYIAKSEIRKFVPAEYDDKMHSIQQACFMSSDANVFYNPNATEFDVGLIEFKDVYEPTPVAVSNHDRTETTTIVNEHFGPKLEELLPFIDKNLRYKQRFPIICGAMSVYGKDCIPALLNHFNKNREEFEEQLNKIFSEKSFGSYGVVVNAAKAGGYRDPAPRAVAGQKPQPSSHQFPSLLQPQEGKEFVRREVEDFFQTGKSRGLCIPCGLGKTTETIRKIARNIEDHRIVFFAPTHALAEQHAENLREELRSIYGDVKGNTLAARVKHIYGNTILGEDGKPDCRKSKLQKRLNEFEAGLSVKDCINCPHFANCAYVQQFEDTDLVRFMVTENLFLPMPKWWHGVTINGNKKTVKTSGFEPDFIIVDEDSLKFDPATFASSKTLIGLQNVLDDVEKICGEVTKAEISAIMRKHEARILKDFSKAERLRSDTVIRIRNGLPVKGLSISRDHFAILKSAYNYLTSNYDASFLHGMTFRREEIVNGYDISKALVQHSLRKINWYFEGKPILFLDATANDKVFAAAYPNVPLKKLAVKFPNHVKVFQLTNTSASRAHLGNPKNVERIVLFVKSKIKQFGIKDASIGIITYRDLAGNENFLDDVAKQLGATVKGYFGGMRGRNDFEHVDVEVIIGRQKLDQKALNSYSYAIFDKPYIHDESVCARPIRMKGGRAMSLESLYPSGITERAIYDHFCTGETVQMIGRARPYWGKPKIIIYCSNESLGGDVEITDFISFDDDKYSDVVNEAKKLGVVNLRKPAERAAVGISSHDWRENRVEVIDALAADGGQRCIVSGTYENRHKFVHEYIVFDHEKLKAMTANTNFTVEEVDRFHKLFG